MRYFAALGAFASCILPILAQSDCGKPGSGCEIVANVTVVSGNTLFGIANANGVTVEQILFVNPQITNRNLILVGDVIAIPDPGCIPGPPPPQLPIPCSAPGTVNTYTVVTGDTLSRIAAEKFNTTLAAVIAANPQITNPDLIDIGQVINVPPCQQVPIACSKPGALNTYIVVSGDTLWTIATQKFNTTLAAVIAANPQITNPDAINVGDVINVPACVPEAPVPCSLPGKVNTYIVVRGDTLWTIATQKFNTTLAAVIAANPQITNPDAINVGDVINVPACCSPNTPAPKPKPTSTSTKDCSDSGDAIYIVKSGDTFWKIATEIYHITLDALVAANPGVDSTAITPGQKVNIPQCGKPNPQSPPKSTETSVLKNCSDGKKDSYTVKHGDSMWVIATQKFSITLDSLIAANKQVKDPSFIIPKQKLHIPLCKKHKSKKEHKGKNDE